MPFQYGSRYLMAQRWLQQVPVLDGTNRPNDTGGPVRLAGILRFEFSP